MPYLERQGARLYYQEVGEVPVNGTAEHGIEHLRFTPDEVEKFTVIPDWDHLGKELDGWNKRFEKDIVPNL